MSASMSAEPLCRFYETTMIAEPRRCHSLGKCYKESERKRERKKERKRGEYFRSALSQSTMLRQHVSEKGRCHSLYAQTHDEKHSKSKILQHDSNLLLKLIAF